MRLFELQDRPVLDKVFPRNIMPQIRKNNLDDAGYEYEKKKIKLSKLKPVQDQRVQGMHDRAMKGFQDGSIRPIIIDKYNYIVNGHHRYDVARSLDMNKVKVIKVNATIEELIDRFSETASDEPTLEEQFKAKLQQKLNEIGKDKPYGNEDDNSYIASVYNNASGNQPFGEDAYIKIAPIPGIPNNEVYDNGTSRHIFVLNREQPIFMLTLKKGLGGWITTNVVTHSKFRGKGFAVHVYMAVSKAYKQPLYSFQSQTPAGNKVWQNLAKKIPNRVVGYDTHAKKEIPFDGVYDGNLHTRAKLLPESVQEDVVGMNPHAKKPYFTPEEADRAYDEWVNQAQVDQEDGVIIKATDGKQYRIMTSYNNEHFEDGEVYLDGVTDPKYIDTEGYPDAAELLYYHSATGHYPDFEEEVEENFPVPPTNDKLLQKIRNWKIKGHHGDRPSSTGIQAGDSELFSMCHNYLMNPDNPMAGKLEVLQKLDLAMDIDSSETPTEKDVYDYIRGTGVDMPFTPGLGENFKDGKVKGKSRPGRVKRAGASCKGSVTSLRKKAKNSSGEKSKMYHWCANMKAGRKKK